MKPFSTYPEDRAKLLELARRVEAAFAGSAELDEAAYALADLVRAILTDEAVAIDNAEAAP